MSKCHYHAIINKIQTVTCHYSFIVNELGEKIVWYVDEAQSHNFESPYELSFIVDAEDPACEVHEKSKFSAVLKVLSLSSDPQVNLTEVSEFKAIFNQQSTYRADILCSSTDLQFLHTFFASSILSPAIIQPD